MMGLLVRSLIKQYEGRRVLDEVSFELDFGESLAVLGPSGSGKTTLLNLLGALDRPDDGEIALNGRSIVKLNEQAAEAYRRVSIGFVFQDHLLLPELTGLQNILLPMIGRCDGDVLKRAEELTHWLGIAHRAHAYPWQMSGGERQRFAVARAVLHKPPLVLCDEPTGNLDPSTGENVVSVLLDLAREHGAMVVLATHNEAHARRCGKRFRLTGGRLAPTV